MINLAAGKLDFPHRAAPPDKVFMIACAQRVGSTLLALSLWKRGVFGAPMSYFNPWTMQSYQKRLKFSTDREYVDFLQSTRTSPNGVFAYKMGATHWCGLQTETPFLASRIRAHAAIFLRRRNVVAQAISQYKAFAAGDYFPDDADAFAKVPYDFRKLSRRVAHINSENALWSEIFEVLGVTPVEAWYEDLTEEKRDDIAAQLAARLGIELKDHDLAGIALPVLKKLSNAVSLEWEDRFRIDLGKLRDCDLITDLQ